MWLATFFDELERIFAEPGTITGSIGIFAIIPSFERTLAQYGVTTDGVKTTPLSGQPDPIGGLSPAVEQAAALPCQFAGEAVERLDRLRLVRIAF